MHFSHPFIINWAKFYFSITIFNIYFFYSDDDNQCAKRSNTSYKDTPWKDQPDDYRSKKKESDTEVTKSSTKNNTQSSSQNRVSRNNRYDFWESKFPDDRSFLFGKKTLLFN
jgi:hypothetical protein